MLGQTNAKVVTGGSQQRGEYFVKVIDYDGTVLDEQWLDDGAEYTLPSAPDNTSKGLVFQEWSCSETITNGKITIDKNNVMVGAIYTTASGQNEVDVEVNANTGLSVTVYAEGVKDWGDGTSSDTTAHTYSSYGQYTIKFSGAIRTNLITYSSGFFAQNSNGNYYAKAVRFATSLSSTGIPNNMFNYCFSLEYITIPKDQATSVGTFFTTDGCKVNAIILPNSVTSFGGFNSYSVRNIVIPKGVTSVGNITCSLRNIVIPKGVTSVGVFSNSYALEEINLFNVSSIGGFDNCCSLKKVKISGNVTSIPTYCFRQNYSLEEVEIPDSVTSFSQYSFYNDYSLRKINIPNSVTSFDVAVFSNCHCVEEYDFSKLNSIPTLGSTSVFSGINKLCKIKVPTALYDQWIVAQYWSTYASNIVAV